MLVLPSTCVEQAQLITGKAPAHLEDSKRED